MKTTKLILSIVMLIFLTTPVMGQLGTDKHCSVCKDTGNCIHCNGTGDKSSPVTCSYCKGTGTVKDYLGSTISCEKCYGSGNITRCFSCDGTGFCQQEVHAWSKYNKTEVQSHRKIKMDGGLWLYFIVIIGVIIAMVK
jgi:DnaJ-class molecular chaperone